MARGLKLPQKDRLPTCCSYFRPLKVASHMDDAEQLRERERERMQYLDLLQISLHRAEHNSSPSWDYTLSTHTHMTRRAHLCLFGRIWSRTTITWCVMGISHMLTILDKNYIFWPIIVFTCCYLCLSRWSMSTTSFPVRMIDWRLIGRDGWNGWVGGWTAVI